MKMTIMDRLKKLLGVGKEPRDVALVLSSGGARGLAHIGAIEELESRGYHICSVTGSSMGALVGGMYAAGRLTEFKEWLLTVNKRKMLSLTDFSLSLNHLVKGKKIIEALQEIVPDVMIEDLPIPYCAVATDWENSRVVEFRSGSLYEAIRASISIPLFFDPVRNDGRLLVDGGVLNPLPLKQGKVMPGSLLVAVNVNGYEWGGKTELRKLYDEHRKRRRSFAMKVLERLFPESVDLNYVTIGIRMYLLMLQQNAANSILLHKPDIVVNVPMNRFGGFDYDKVEKISRLGRSKMRKALDGYEGRTEKRKR